MTSFEPDTNECGSAASLTLWKAWNVAILNKFSHRNQTHISCRIIQELHVSFSEGTLLRVLHYVPCGGKWGAVKREADKLSAIYWVVAVGPPPGAIFVVGKGN